MKKSIILLVLALLFLSGCPTCPEVIKYIEVQPPKRQPLPHPVLPVIDPDAISQVQLMEQLLIMAGAMEKLQVLIEIYEREWCDVPEGYSNPKYSGKTLEELKIEYYRLLGIYQEYLDKLEEEKKKSEEPSTPSVDPDPSPNPDSDVTPSS